ncbi:class I SAM-dependent methyltransferase [Aquicoccus sp. SU-CL01552]|uniref:class I SAM-dependent methyltransferase n=1 Tax=Aquicoccus sp. SU-CL01552 TaxID=3127656 RepID=UPI00310C5A56
MAGPADSYALDGESGNVSPLMTLPGDWRRPSDRSTYTIYWRAEDGYGQILPRPEAADIPAFYDVDGYYTHDADADEADPAPAPGFGRRLLHHLAWRLDRGTEATDPWWRAVLGPAPKSVLEIGCGSGNTLARLKASGYRVRGVEPDPEAIRAATAKGVKVFAGTAEDIPDDVSGTRYDAVLMMHVLEHCLDPVRAVRNALAQVKAGGTLTVEVPNNGCMGLRAFGRSWLWLDVPRHLNFFTRQSLEGLLTSCGSRLRTTEFWGFSRQFSSGWLATQDRIAGAFSQPPRNSLPFLAGLLSRMAIAPAHLKYDSVRCIVGKPAQTTDTAPSTPQHDTTPESRQR